VRLTKKTLNSALIFLTLIVIVVVQLFTQKPNHVLQSNAQAQKDSYWFELQRGANIENLYKGTPGDKSKSEHIKSFKVKTGIPGERPTPLPKLVGKEYWIITDKQPQPDNPETAPYFLTLNIPAPDEEPYGPVPYTECSGSASAGPDGQCSWVLPGAFGLHGTGGNPAKISDTDPGSSGCIRHSDEDISYLYNLLDPANQEIRYYITE
jgi:hypothetical protein